ncbi:accessory Sec system protein Asp2, partial [Staphylococcus epidermidis]|uniref:accessory Sec system protein Asp2 n=1 Tax=Staphylococcus epidermidis TaxID=1282 RepID=UPI0037D9CB26
MKLITYLNLIFQLPPKFTLLQLPPHHLPSLFNQKTNLESHYFHLPFFHFQNPYQHLLLHILHQKPQFDFVFLPQKYSHLLIKLLSLLTTPYNTLIHNHYSHNQYQQHNTIQPSFI